LTEENEVEEKRKADAKVTISVDSADWHLGIANALLALHRTHGLDLKPFLTEFDRINKATHIAGEDGEKLYSKAGETIAQYVSDLATKVEPKEESLD
jgi:hypothetical protein